MSAILCHNGKHHRFSYDGYCSDCGKHMDRVLRNFELEHLYLRHAAHDMYRVLKALPHLSRVRDYAVDAFQAHERALKAEKWDEADRQYKHHGKLIDAIDQFEKNIRDAISRYESCLPAKPPKLQPQLRKEGDVSR